MNFPLVTQTICLLEVQHLGASKLVSIPAHCCMGYVRETSAVYLADGEFIDDWVLVPSDVGYVKVWVDYWMIDPEMGALLDTAHDWVPQSTWNGGTEATQGYLKSRHTSLHEWGEFKPEGEEF